MKWAWRRLRRLVFIRDGYRCVACGRAGRLECDHKLPTWQGGSSAMENLQTLCRNCHIEKSRVERQRVKGPAAVAWAALVNDLQRRTT